MWPSQGRTGDTAAEKTVARPGYLETKRAHIAGGPLTGRGGKKKLAKDNFARACARAMASPRVCPLPHFHSCVGFYVCPCRYF